MTGLLVGLLASALAAPLPSLPESSRWFVRAVRVEAVGRDKDCAEAVDEAVERVRTRLARRELRLGVFVDADSGEAIDQVICDGRQVRVTAIGVEPGGRRFPTVTPARTAEVAALLGKALWKARFEVGNASLWLVQDNVGGVLGLDAGESAMLTLSGDLDWLREMPELAGLGADIAVEDGPPVRFRFARDDLEAFDAGAIDADALLARARRGTR